MVIKKNKEVEILKSLKDKIVEVNEELENLLYNEWYSSKLGSYIKIATYKLKEVEKDIEWILKEHYSKL